MRLVILSAVMLSVTSSSARGGSAPDLVADARMAISRAGHYFADEVAFNGGYVYFYSLDLKRRLGEGVAKPTEIWVQPPGTPTVGLAFVSAWKATGDQAFLDAATAAAEALLYGQLKSGGWTNSVDFNPQTASAAYRNGRGRGKNFSTLDDGITQAALQLLMQVDQAHEFNHREIHAAVQTGLNAMLAAQFTTGAFPQGWDEVAVQIDQPVVKAHYPAYDWRTEGRIKEYWDLYTLNDGAAGTVTDTLLMAAEIYQSERYTAALRSLGNFLLIAQMPAPQSAWAQQYNFQMIPVWARKFEPPAVAGRESQDVISALMKISAATGDQRYLSPIPDALQYLEASRLPDGRLARYYELQSNRPLYMKRQGKIYSLTYDDTQLTDHYGWKVENNVNRLRSEYQKLTAGAKTDRAKPVSEDEAARLTRSLDSVGRWVTEYNGERLIGQAKFARGDRYLASEVFSENIRTLSRFVQQNSTP